MSVAAGQITDVDDLGALAFPPIAVLRQTAAQTGIANSTFTAITFGFEDIDTYNGHSTAVNNTRYTAQKAGKYQLSGGVAWAANTAGQRWTRWAKNGVEIEGSGTSVNATSSGQALTPARTIIVGLAVGDYVELQGLQSSGGPLDTYVGVAYAQSSMTVQWVSE